MNAMANEFDLAQATMLPPMPGAPREAPDAAVLSEQWAAVHEAAGAVGGLAQLGRERWVRISRTFPNALPSAGAGISKPLREESTISPHSCNRACAHCWH